MYLNYIFILLCSFLNYSFGKIQSEDVNPSGTNKIYKLDQNIINLLEQKIPTLFFLINALDTKMSEDLERNRDFQSVILKKMTDLEENINRKLDLLTNNVTKTADEMTSCKSDALKKIDNLEDNVIKKLDTLDEIPTKFQENVNFKLDQLALNISNELEGKINSKLDALKNVTDFKEIETLQIDHKENKPVSVCNASAVTEKTPNGIQLPCKEVTLRFSYSPDFKMGQSNNHVTQKINSTHLKYFEMHMAIKADHKVFIMPWNQIACKIYIGWDDNQYTTLELEGAVVQRIHTPNILSIDQFKAFYIKINDGNLEFGKEGDNSPLISYYNQQFSLLSTFTFFHWEHTEAVIRYDCPAPVEVCP